MDSQSAVPVVAAAAVVVDVAVAAVVAAVVFDVDVVDVATLSHFSGSDCRGEKYCNFLRYVFLTST